MTKRSFFERLSGSAAADAFDSFDEETTSTPSSKKDVARRSDDDTANAEGQLPIDVHQTPSEIIIRAFVAGVRPDELNISISRDRVEIEGSRMERDQVSGSDYFTRELFWGSFTRAIMLPEEVDVEESTASTKDGLLTIVLPKLDKARQTKLKVKAG
jgi:HSP20 family protein